MKFIKENKLVTDITGSLSKQLIEVKKTVTIASNSSNFFTTVVNFDQYEIKTAYAATDTGDPVTLSIFDSSAADNEIYKSLAQSLVNDIVAVPCRDKSGNKSIYIRATNGSSNTINVNIVVKLVNL